MCPPCVSVVCEILNLNKRAADYSFDFTGQCFLVVKFSSLHPLILIWELVLEFSFACFISLTWLKFSIIIYNFVFWLYMSLLLTSFHIWSLHAGKYVTYSSGPGNVDDDAFPPPSFFAAAAFQNSVSFSLWSKKMSHLKKSNRQQEVITGSLQLSSMLTKHRGIKHIGPEVSLFKLVQLLWIKSSIPQN